MAAANTSAFKLGGMLEANKYFFVSELLSARRVLKVIISPKTLAVSAKVKGVLDSNNPCLDDRY